MDGVLIRVSNVMTKQFMRTTAIAAVLMGSFASASMAGGLADQITERQPEIVEQQPRSMPGWLLPALGLLVIGVIVSQSDDDPAPDPDPEPEPEPEDPKIPPT